MIVKRIRQLDGEGIGLVTLRTVTLLSNGVVSQVLVIGALVLAVRVITNEEGVAESKLYMYSTVEVGCVPHGQVVAVPRVVVNLKSTRFTLATATVKTFAACAGIVGRQGIVPPSA